VLWNVTDKGLASEGVEPGPYMVQLAEMHFALLKGVLLHASLGCWPGFQS